MTSKNLKPWRYSVAVALLLFSPFNILASLGMDIYLPVVPLMPEAFGTSPDVIQLTLTLYMIIIGVGQIVFGPISDRIGRRPVLLSGAVMFAIGSLGIAITSGISSLLGFRFIQAIGASAMLVAVFSTVRDVYADRAESVTIYGLMNAMLAFVPAIGPLIGTILAGIFGWRAIFIALGLPVFILLPFVLKYWHETKAPRKPSAFGGFSRVLRSRLFWAYTMAFGSAMGAFFVFFSIAPRILIGRMAMSELGFSLAFGSVAIVMILTTRFTAMFNRNWGARGCVLRGMALMIIGACLLYLGDAGLQQSVVSFILPMCMIAVGIVMANAVAANGALAEFGDMAGTAVALHFSIQSIIVGLVGTSFVIWFDGTTVWPLIGFIFIMATLTTVLVGSVRQPENHLNRA